MIINFLYKFVNQWTNVYFAKKNKFSKKKKEEETNTQKTEFLSNPTNDMIKKLNLLI